MMMGELECFIKKWARCRKRWPQRRSCHYGFPKPSSKMKDIKECTNATSLRKEFDGEIPESIELFRQMSPGRYQKTREMAEERCFLDNLEKYIREWKWIYDETTLTGLRKYRKKLNDDIINFINTQAGRTIRCPGQN